MSVTTRRTIGTLSAAIVCVGLMVASRWTKITAWWADYGTDALRAMAGVLLAPVVFVCLFAVAWFGLSIWTVDRSAQRIARHAVGIVIVFVAMAGVMRFSGFIVPEDWQGLVFIGGVVLVMFLLWLFGNVLNDLPLAAEEVSDDNPRYDKDNGLNWAQVSRRMRDLYGRRSENIQWR